MRYFIVKNNKIIKEVDKDTKAGAGEDIKILKGCEYARYKCITLRNGEIHSSDYSLRGN